MIDKLSLHEMGLTKREKKNLSPDPWNEISQDELVQMVRKNSNGRQKLYVN